MRRFQLLFLTAIFVVALPGFAAAAPTLIWNTYEQNTISAADATGGNGRNLFTSTAFPVAVDSPNGTTLDAARGKVFWANTDGADGIYSGNLSDTSGAPCLIVSGANTGDFPLSMAYDPTRNLLYWYEDVFNAPSTIRYVEVPSNCSGATPSTLYQESQYPTQMKGVNGIAIDPANNRIYWANGDDGTVGYANLDGSTPANSAGLIDLAACNLDVANSVNVDPATNRLYVGAFSGTDAVVAVSDLDGGNCVSSAVGLPADGGAWGVTRNDATLFAGNYGDGKIDTWLISSFPSSSTAFVPGGTATLAEAQFPAMLDVPIGNATVSPATAEAGTELTCSSTWSVGTPGMQRYRAPAGSTAYTWSKDGEVVAGATNATLNAQAAGDYTCTAAASNFAGTGTATATAKVSSSPSGKPKIGVSVKAPKKVKAGKRFTIGVKTTNKAKSQTTKSTRAAVPTTAQSVKTCIALPRGVFVVERNGGKVSGGSICWTRNALKAGGSVSYSVVVRSSSNASGSELISASVRASNSSGATVKASAKSRVQVVATKPRPKPQPPTG